MRPSAVYSNTIVSVLGSKILDEYQIKRMIAAASFGEAAQVLLECGYDPNIISNTEDDEDRIIGDEMKRCVEMFKRLCPDEGLLEIMLAQFDYHNARILYKSRFDTIDLYDATYRFGAIDFEKLERAIAKKEYTFLPDNLRNALKTVDAVPVPAADEIDAAFNKYLTAETEVLAKKIKSTAVREYIKTKDEKFLKDCDNSFGLEKFLKWFILKRRELAIVQTVLIGKKLGLSRDKIRGLVKGVK